MPGRALLLFLRIPALLLFVLRLRSGPLGSRLTGLLWSFARSFGGVVVRLFTSLPRLFCLRLLSCPLRFSFSLGLPLPIRLAFRRLGLTPADRRPVPFGLGKKQWHRASIRRLAFWNRGVRPGLRKLRQQKRQAGCDGR
ncbi:hypothetical protein GCM10011402_24970 [Paracoccus acridae]|uniref:Secreted protein n=1 Tax=Paracoccus acridae TaxID=1795310 RepID=A0ABQ1VJ96_9RHOB|nr:hypothetical protein GCM10011402_24970 [Paracoccus acridae]